MRRIGALIACVMVLMETSTNIVVTGGDRGAWIDI